MSEKQSDILCIKPKNPTSEMLFINVKNTTQWNAVY